MFRIASSLHRGLGKGAVNLAKIVATQLDVSRAKILFQTMQFRGARYGHNPRLLGEQPRERDLRRRFLLLLCNLTKHINQSLIGFPSFGRKAREYVAEIRTVERGIFVDLSREEASTQRTVRNKADSEFFESRQYFRFRLSEP